MSVKLHLADLALVVTFTYLPALGIVTAETNHNAGNELLATLFKADSGEDTPSMGNKHIGDGSFVFDSQATARPYRSAFALPHSHMMLQLHLDACIMLATQVASFVCSAKSGLHLP